MKSVAAAILLTFVAFAGGARAADAFDRIKCGVDVATALIGHKLPDGTIVAIEGKHAALGLKDLGAEEISDNLGSTSWMICGQEYMVLDERNVVRDVLAVPPHSKSTPLFSDGTCELNGKETPFLVVAILDYAKTAPVSVRSTKATFIAAKVAWQLDEKNKKYVKLDPGGLTCPRSGIITLDGGP